MNDYRKGALEALTWVQYILKKYRSRPNSLSIIDKEMETAKIESNTGVETSFRDKVSYVV